MISFTLNLMLSVGGIIGSLLLYGDGGIIGSLLLYGVDSLLLYGDGENVREWSHVSDHVRGIQTVIEKGLPGEIYNIGSGAHLSNNDLATQILIFMGMDENFKSYISDRKGHDFRYSINSTKIEKLGYKIIIPLEEGLKETVSWYLSNSTWWDGL